MGKPKIVRRKLHFNNMEDILNDAKSLVASGVNASGNWNTGQIVGHITAVMLASIEGFPFSLPMPIRLFGRLIRNRAMKKGFPSGIKIPSQAGPAFDPPPDLSFDQAVEQLASAIEKAKQHKMTHASPVFGVLTHDQWIQFHCRHAELHFSFMHPNKKTEA